MSHETLLVKVLGSFNFVCFLKMQKYEMDENLCCIQSFSSIVFNNFSTPSNIYNILNRVTDVIISIILKFILLHPR